jgi:hypothetical protein
LVGAPPSNGNVRFALGDKRLNEVTSMPSEIRPLSDKALAVFAFAAYHQLESGQQVSSVVQRDHAGHKADEEAVGELQEFGLARADGSHVHFTDAGERLLQAVIAGMRSAAGGG